MTTMQQTMVITEDDIPVAMNGRELSQREQSIRQLWLTCEDFVAWIDPGGLCTDEYGVGDHKLHAIEITPQGALEVYTQTTLLCCGELRRLSQKLRVRV